MCERLLVVNVESGCYKKLLSVRFAVVVLVVDVLIIIIIINMFNVA